MTTALWILGALTVITYGLTTYFWGRAHEHESTRWEHDRLEQERDQALFERDQAIQERAEAWQERDESRKLLSNRVTVNSRLRVKMLDMERENVRLRESLLNARLKMDNRVTAYREN